jgi:hypothetical protein
MNTDTVFSRNNAPQGLSNSETLNLHPDFWYFSHNRRDRLKASLSTLSHIHTLLKTVVMDITTLHRIVIEVYLNS